LPTCPPPVLRTSLECCISPVCIQELILKKVKSAANNTGQPNTPQMKPVTKAIRTRPPNEYSVSRGMNRIDSPKTYGLEITSRLFNFAVFFSIRENHKAKSSP